MAGFPTALLSTAPNEPLTRIARLRIRFRTAVQGVRWALAKNADNSRMRADVEIRLYRSDDEQAVLDLSLRAWAPAYQAWRTILGDQLYATVYLGWRTSQAKAVAGSLRTNGTLVGLVDGTVAGFITTALQSPQTGEVDMLSVDPDYQRLVASTNKPALQGCRSSVTTSRCDATE